MPIRAVLVRAVLAFGFLAVATASPAAAFGRDGHRIVCDIAYDHLTTIARAEVDRLMALDEVYAKFRDACSWADKVRGENRPETAPLHYVGLAREDPVVDLDDCPAEGCVLSAVIDDGTRLADHGLDDRARLEALKFLGHWVGDVHQPLHVSIDGDRGGNDLNALWRGERRSNFHRMWDTEIILDYLGARWAYLPPAARVDQFALELKSELAVAGVEVRAPLDPVPWAQESHDYARSRDIAYQYADADAAYAPGAHYYERHLPDMKKRLKQAGVRLAAVLNTLLDPVE